MGDQTRWMCPECHTGVFHLRYGEIDPRLAGPGQLPARMGWTATCIGCQYVWELTPTCAMLLERK